MENPGSDNPGSDHAGSDHPGSDHAARGDPGPRVADSRDRGDPASAGPSSAAAPDAGRKTNNAPQIPEEQAVTRGRRWVAPMTPPEALNAYVAPRARRRRRKDWPVLMLALVISALVFVGCCIAGFAMYSTRASLFK
jgi:hypothetical protein